MEMLPKDQTLALRNKHIGSTCKLWFKENPLKIVRAQGQYMFDENGTKYLDCINNVCHVGHCHPEVAKAGADQMMVLNTNSRFLHDNLVVYADRLTKTLPPNLTTLFMANSGSEANDLALRLSRKFTGNYDVICLNHAYHGNLTQLIDISPYKHNKPCMEGKKEWVHVVEPPDTYRGTHCDAENPGEMFALEVKKAIDAAHANGRKIAAFIVESLQSCGGQLIYPTNYLKLAFKYAREAGALCICDEVQVGFGRVGTHMWAFEHQDVIPDIVVMGKPMGNGHPVSGVVTTKEIAEKFAEGGHQYFNTYGGNPVSSAIALKVLDVIEKEKLKENATLVGGYLLKELSAMKEKYSIIGDVRGRGLFIGIELVTNRKTKSPASGESTYVVTSMREKKILISTEGPYGNIIKFKPPMCFSMDDARFLLEKFTTVFKELLVLKGNTQNYDLAMNNLVDPAHALPFPKAHVGIMGLPSMELLDFPDTSMPAGGAAAAAAPASSKRKRSPAPSDEGFDESIKKQKITLVVEEDVDDELDMD